MGIANVAVAVLGYSPFLCCDASGDRFVVIVANLTAVARQSQIADFAPGAAFR